MARSEPPSASWTGDVVGGRYRLEAPIGRGGMATIWRAVHLDLNRPVALKFLTIQAADPAAVRERFLREARLAAAVRHRNVVDITDFGTAEDGRPFMVMELLEGESLADRMSVDPSFGLPDVVRLGARALSGLGAVHDAGIIHRDLKPENVFLVRDADGVYPKLLDFGISRSLEDGLESVVPSSDNVLAGTPQYMSPEQARGIKDLDARSDLWSMGVILYEMLTGRLPYEADNTGDLIVMLLTADPVAVERLRPDLGEPLAAVIARALARDRDQRFSTAREMRQALLNAATQTAAALQRARTEKPSELGSVSDHPALVPKDLMDAVGSAYEPGDSGMLSVVDVPTRRAPRWSAETVSDGEVALPAAADWRSVGGRLRSKADRRLALAGAAIVGLAALAAVAMVWWAGPSGEPTSAASPADPAPTAADDEVMVTLRRLPQEASVTVDGAAHDGPAVRLPKDGEPHAIEVNAPGYEPWLVHHRATGDGAYDVALEPLPAGPTPEPSRAGRGAGRRVRARPDELIRDPGF